MLQYYTLEEAAKLLGIPPDQGKKLLDERKVRQYRDGRGKVRYVASAVEELARSLGQGSEPDLQLGEAPPPKTGNSPAPRKSQADNAGVFDFNLGTEEDSDQVELGKPPVAKAGDSRKGSSSSGRLSGPPSPTPQPGSDSDVRLVADGSNLEFQVVDSPGGGQPPSSSRSGSGPGSSQRRTGSPIPEDTGEDSGVRIVPFEPTADSGVGMGGEAGEGSVPLGESPSKRHSDSDIRLEGAAPPPRPDSGSDDSLVTEEIDLDAEERKAAATSRAKKERGKKMRPGTTQPALPTSSPFELSESDLEMPAASSGKGPLPSDSSDMELTPAAEESLDSIELSSSDFDMEKPSDSSDEVPLGEARKPKGDSKGINLQAPADSGISLEKPSDSDSESEEVDLSREPGATTGYPALAGAPEDSSSEFELSLDADSSSEEHPAAAAGESSDSEFELSLDAESPTEQPAPAAEDSDSEFELTLDESGSLMPLEQKAKGEGQDIFETDFEVPALEEESGSDAVVLEDSDTDLESSEFDLAIGEEDVASDEESGSQVVALEDESEVDEAAATVARPKKRRPASALAEEDVDQLLEADEEEEEAEKEPVPGKKAVAAAPPAPWGAVPALVMLPCVVIMILAGLMGYELIHGMWGYQQPNKVSGFLTDNLARQFTDDLPK